MENGGGLAPSYTLSPLSQHFAPESLAYNLKSGFLGSLQVLQLLTFQKYSLLIILLSMVKGSDKGFKSSLVFPVVKVSFHSNQRLLTLY